MSGCIHGFVKQLLNDNELPSFLPLWFESANSCSLHHWRGWTLRPPFTSSTHSVVWARLNQLHRIIWCRVYLNWNWPSLNLCCKSFSGRGSIHQRQRTRGVKAVAIKPVFVQALVQHHWHATVYGAKTRRGWNSNNCIRIHCLLLGMVEPSVIQCSESHGTPVSALEVKGELSPGWPLPLIESIHHNQTSLLGNEVLKRGFLQKGLGSCIYRAGTKVVVQTLNTLGNKSPPHAA